MNYCTESFPNVPEVAAAFRYPKRFMWTNLRAIRRYSQKTVLYVNCHNKIIPERLQFRH